MGIKIVHAFYFIRKLVILLVLDFLKNLANSCTIDLVLNFLKTLIFTGSFCYFDGDEENYIIYKTWNTDTITDVLSYQNDFNILNLSHITSGLTIQVLSV